MACLINNFAYVIIGIHIGSAVYGIPINRYGKSISAADILGDPIIGTPLPVTLLVLCI